MLHIGFAHAYLQVVCSRPTRDALGHSILFPPDYHSVLLVYVHWLGFTFGKTIYISPWELWYLPDSTSPVNKTPLRYLLLFLRFGVELSSPLHQLDISQTQQPLEPFTARSRSPLHTPYAPSLRCSKLESISQQKCIESHYLRFYKWLPSSSSHNLLPIAIKGFSLVRVVGHKMHFPLRGVKREIVRSRSWIWHTYVTTVCLRPRPSVVRLGVCGILGGVSGSCVGVGIDLDRHICEWIMYFLSQASVSSSGFNLQNCTLNSLTCCKNNNTNIQYMYQLPHLLCSICKL